MKLYDNVVMYTWVTMYGLLEFHRIYWIPYKYNADLLYKLQLRGNIQLSFSKKYKSRFSEREIENETFISDCSCGSST